MSALHRRFRFLRSSRSPLLLGALLLLSLGLGARPVQPGSTDPKAIIDRMIETIGGATRLHELRDVELTYTYHRVMEGTEDVSLERYIFDGELSWARFDKHEVFVLPGTEGPVFSYFDGERTVSKHDGQLVTGDAAAPLAFLRKTNFYWFAMFFKLGDPGLEYEYLGTREVEHIDYDIVQVTFGESVGDSPEDRYVLYVNPYTHLVDLFLFNVTGFDMNDPFLMKVKYSLVDGALLPLWRSYQPALGWDSHLVQEDAELVLQLTEGVKFGNGFGRTDFELR